MPLTAEQKRQNAAAKLLSTAHMREAELATFLLEFDKSMDTSDGEKGMDVEAPILKSVYLLEGQAGLVTLTNFTSDEFEELWGLMRDHVGANWNVGRGRKTVQKPKDVLMMMLSVLKRGKPWDVVAQSYNMAAPAFKKLVSGFIEVILGYLFNLLVDTVPQEWSMDRLKKENKQFKNFPCVFYTVDVRFQQANHLSGSHSKAKPYFSGKHKLYGVITKVGVNLVGLAVHCTKHKKGSVVDKSILLEHLETHLSLCCKSAIERSIEDNGPFRNHHPNHWSMIADKGYQGIKESCCMVLSKKKPRNRNLSLNDKLGNTKVASDQIIVENFFGRLCSLWGLMHKKFWWSFEKYNTLNQLLIALINFHITNTPCVKKTASFFSKLAINCC